MSLEHSHVARLRMIKEGAGAANFGKDKSASLGSYVEARFRGAQVNLRRDMLRDEALVQRVFQERLDILGRKSAEMTLDLDLTPTGSELNAGASPPGSPAQFLLQFLQTVFGGYQVSPGSAIVAGGSASSIRVTDTHATRFPPGSAIGCPVAGFVEAREVASTGAGDGTHDVVVPKVQLSATPTTAGSASGSHTIYLTDDPSDSMGWVLETRERDDIWWVAGTQLRSLSFELTLNALARMQSQVQGAQWFHDDDVGTQIGSGSPLGVGTLTDGDPLPFVDSAVFFTKGAVPKDGTDVSDSKSIGRIPLSSITISPEIPYEAVPSPSGVNGILRYKMKPGRPVCTAQITFPFEVEQLWEDRDARTKFGLWAQIGNIAGKVVLISLPNVQIVDIQRAETEPRLNGQIVTVKCLEDEEATDQTTELRRSPIRIHLL